MADPVQSLAWHHLRFIVPRNWEVVRHSSNEDEGRLILADRHDVTMQIFWARIGEKPVLPRRLFELVQSLTVQSGAPAPDETEFRMTLCECNGWLYHRPARSDFPLFAGRHLEKSRILLNVTFPPHLRHDHRIHATPILSSYRTNDGSEAHWAIAGIHGIIPREYRLERFEPLPAAQKMTFETRKEYRISLYRFGMMSRHLRNQSLEEFFANTIGKKRGLTIVGPFRKGGGIMGIELRYRTRGTGNIVMNLLSKRWIGRIFLWKCPERERIYAIEQHALEGKEIGDLSDRMATT